MPAADTPSTSPRYLVRNALLFDGDCDAGYGADLLIEDGRFRAVSRTPLPPAEGVEEIDATGMWATPGFIDIHTHYDAEVEINPGLGESVRHGVTTVSMGSCGLSLVMGSPEDLADMFTRVEGIPSEYVKSLLRDVKDWDGPASYWDHLAGLPLGPNLATFVGHSTIRAATMGMERSLSTGNEPTAGEMGKMDGALREALDAGFLGLSLNLLHYDRMDGDRYRSRPTPSVYAKWKEYRHLCRTLRERDRILQTIPNFQNPATYFSFMWESTGIFRKPLKTSTLAMIDGKTTRGAHRMLGLSARVANRFFGAQFKWQGLPEPFDVHVDGMVIPFFEEFEAGTQYIHLLDMAERRELLLDPKYRKLFRRQWKNRFQPRVFHRDLRDTSVVACPDARLQGKSFAEIARETGNDPVFTFLDLVAEHGSGLRWYTVVGNDRPDELNWIVSHPDCHIGFSDAGAHLRNMGHYNFPLRLLRFVRDREAAGKPTPGVARTVRKLTSELADWYLLDAGRVREGGRADLVLIDPEKLDARVDEVHEEGMPGLPEFRRIVRRNDATVPYVFINGRVAWSHGRASPELGSSRSYGRMLAALS
jgi:N-acyl-D-aspartate/D-glutamate deacylase